ncbi:helix-turn-helix domain-containing protein [Patulibacter sp. NPDC049589]|uniref:helix-turn-helix domain-containing protein n=1 Tax=Patulibacter sp. NPDC049589 TaxID=3154731 RepID=UPI00342DD876
MKRLPSSPHTAARSDSPGVPSPAVVAVVDRVDREEVVEAVLSALQARVPAYAALIADDLDAPLRQTVRVGCDIEFTALAESRAVSERGRQALADACRNLAFWGTAPEDLLTGFDVAGPLMWERLVRAAQPDELPSLLSAGRHLFSMTEAVQAIHASLRGDDLDGLPEEESLSRHLMRFIPAGLTDADAREAELRLQLTPALLRRPFVLVQDPADVFERGRLARRLRSEGVLAATRPDRIVGLAPDGAWSAAVPEGATVILAEPGPEAPTSALWDELHDAAVAARARDRHGVVELHEMAVECMLLAAPSARRRLRTVIQSLRSSSDSGKTGKVDLLETARATLEGNLVRSRVAALLDVHPSTVRYRTERLEEALGLQLRRPWHRSVLELAIRTDGLPDEPAVPPAVVVRSPPLTEQVIARVAARIDHDLLAGRIVDEIHESLPSFTASGEFDGEALFQEAHAYIDEALFAFRDARPEDHQRRLSAGAMVEGRLRRGVTAADALRALSLSGQLLWDALLDEATPEEAGQLPAVAVRLMRLANPAALVTGIPATHISSPTTAAASEFIIDLLAGGTASNDHIHALARTWGIDPVRSWRPVVAVPADGEPPQRLGAAMRAMGWLAAVRRGRVLALVPAEVGPERLPTSPSLIALGTHGPLADLSQNVADVLLLADVAARRRATGVVTHVEWEVDLLVAANPVTAERLRRRILGQLGASEPGVRTDLVTTMIRHLENDLDRARTARAMHLHPNSLDHRLRSITSRTGLTFSRTEDVLALTLAAAAHASMSA